MFSGIKKQIKKEVSLFKLSNIVENALLLFCFYIIFLFLIVSLSLKHINNIDGDIFLLILSVLALLIIPFFFILLIITKLYNLIISIPEEVSKLKNNKNIFLILKLILEIIFILCGPAIVFSFVYGVLMFIVEFPNNITHFIDYDLFLYSFSVSFPIPRSSIPIYEYQQFLSLIQVIFQRLIEIGVLGYIINIIFEIFNPSKNRNE